MSGTSFRGKSSCCGERVAARRIFVCWGCCIGVLCCELGGTGDLFEEGMKAPVRTREDGRKLAFTPVFDGIMDVAGGGERRYCGESIGEVVYIFVVVEP